MQVRIAEAGDIATILELSQQVQEWLTASGSLQEFGPIPVATIVAHVAAGTAHVLDDVGVLKGGAFVEPAAAPVTPELAQILASLRLLPAAQRLWWLQKLMVAPDYQGHGLGLMILEGVKLHVAVHGGELVGLDCWAGNAKLRDFYTRAGFQLHGELAESGFEVAVFTCQVPAARIPPHGR